jgi:hypothetical protein
MYRNTNCFHLAIPCGDLEKAKKFYSETLGCRLDNADQEWADVDFWGNELTLHASKHKLDSESMMSIWEMYLFLILEYIYLEKILMLLNKDLRTMVQNIMMSHI